MAAKHSKFNTNTFSRLFPGQHIRDWLVGFSGVPLLAGYHLIVNYIQQIVDEHMPV